MVQSQPGQIVLETLSRKTFNQKEWREGGGAGGVAQGEAPKKKERKETEKQTCKQVG
jgi:hypothetical protein